MTRIISFCVAVLLAACGGPSNSPLAHLALSPADVTFAVGGTQQLKLVGTNADGTTADLTIHAEFGSNAPTIANFLGSKAGFLTAIAAGSTIVFATYEGKTTTVDVTVSLPGGSDGGMDAGMEPTLTALTVSPSMISVAAGASASLTATGTYSNRTTQDVTGSATWTSSDSTIATVDSSGNVSGVAQGSATITASFGSFSEMASVTVTVAVPTPTALAISPRPMTITVNQMVQLTATATLSDGSMSDVTSSVAWTSSASTIASVSSAGLVDGLAAGSAVIGAALGHNFSDQIAITVSSTAPPTLTSISLAPTSASIAIGATQQLTATGTYSNASNLALTTGLTWTSSNTAFATVNSSGLVTGGAAGVANITATSGTVTSSAAAITVAASMMGSGCNPVINEVQPGVSGASTNEFIELYNPCSAAVNVAGWTVNYHSSSTAHLLVTLANSIAPNAFVVIGGPAFSGTSDYSYTGSISLSGTGGGVRLSQAGTTGATVDSMAYGSGTNPYVTGSNAPYGGDTSPAHSTARKTDGVNTANNSADFAETSTPTPGAANVITP